MCPKYAMIHCMAQRKRYAAPIAMMIRKNERYICWGK